MEPSVIPVCDPTKEIDRLWDEVHHAVSSVLRSGKFILGPNVSAFEAEMATYLGVRHCIGVNSGTDALVIGLRALGIGPGDEVITPAFTFFATVESISQVGATPVFCDICPDIFTIDQKLVAQKITNDTKAIMCVHLYGHAADMDPILDLSRQYGLKIIEDVAQACGGAYRGKKLGSIGDIGAFSFFPTKNLGACGDGGLIATSDDQIAEFARMLRAHGSKQRYYHETIGYNSRLDELQAAILRTKLPHLDAINVLRRTVAKAYHTSLSGLPCLLPKEQPDAFHVYNQYTVRFPSELRDRIQKYLAQQGIETMVYYPTPIHRLPAYAPYNHVSLPVSERLSEEVLSLPMGPYVSQEVILRVDSVLRSYLAHIQMDTSHLAISP